MSCNDQLLTYQYMIVNLLAYTYEEVVFAVNFILMKENGELSKN